MIVVDTNVLVYVIVQLPQTALAQRVAARDPVWVVPPLWRFEFTSAVTTLVRAAALSAAQAEAALVAADALAAGREMFIGQDAAFRTAIAFDISAYDAQFVALAEQLGVKCVTADVRVLRNVPAVAVSIDDFANSP